MTGVPLFDGEVILNASVIQSPTPPPNNKKNDYTSVNGETEKALY
jgi:hypothetical protein